MLVRPVLNLTNLTMCPEGATVPLPGTSRRAPRGHRDRPSAAEAAVPPVPPPTGSSPDRSRAVSRSRDHAPRPDSSPLIYTESSGPHVHAYTKTWGERPVGKQCAHELVWRDVGKMSRRTRSRPLASVLGPIPRGSGGLGLAGPVPLCLDLVPHAHVGQVGDKPADERV